MILKEIQLFKYKNFLHAQTVKIEDKVTTIVGMNESGKSALLEAMSKINYFEDDAQFKFQEVYDYPRKELKKYQRSGQVANAIECTFYIDDNLLASIQSKIGKDILLDREFLYIVDYNNECCIDRINCDEKKFISNCYKELQKEIKSGEQEVELIEPSSFSDLNEQIGKMKEQGLHSPWSDLSPYSDLSDFIGEKYLAPNIPKFWYYDEYFELPSRIDLRSLHKSQLKSNEERTSKALFELAQIGIKELLNADNYESFKSELEATSNDITDTLFEYWTTNTELEIQFDVEHEETGNNQPSNKYLNIRVKNNKHRITLPLDQRSKGFNWFFSFLVWFSKIQEDESHDYILLLDEPGLNLHAAAQNDLLRFIEKLSEKYQIIYTTHSPFMIPTGDIHRVRTIYDKTDYGAKVSESIQEKDPNTLFPLQAALGYDIAQNLFISSKNLLVEGVSDLVYMTIFSTLLNGLERTSLSEDITIVPVGGLDKVGTFISLLRANKLKLACILDTFEDQKGKQKLLDVISHKIVNQKQIKFFHEFVQGIEIASIEDLFYFEDYINLFNLTFSKKYPTVKSTDYSKNRNGIVKFLTNAIGEKRYNHYLPAYKLSQLGYDQSKFHKDTLDGFEKLFTSLNNLFN